MKAVKRSQIKNAFGYIEPEGVLLFGDEISLLWIIISRNIITKTGKIATAYFVSDK